MKRIIAFIGFTDATTAVVRAAREYAAALQGSLYLIHIADTEAEAADSGTRRAEVRDHTAKDMRARHRRLRLLATVTRKMGVECTPMLVRGSPVRKALQELKRLKPDLVIVGTHGKGRLRHVLPGHVGASVVSRATCPVLVVPAQFDAGANVVAPPESQAKRE